MKKILLVSLLGFGVVLSGCVASPASQMLDNKFLDVQLTPPSTSGVWTTAAGGGLATIKLNSDGRGVMCQDNGRNLIVHQLRNSNDIIYNQSGTSLKVISIDPKLLVTKTTLSAFNVTLQFKGDNDLSLASPACLEKLK